MTKERDYDLILDILKFLQLQPDKPLDIKQYCGSKWGENEEQYNGYTNFLLSHNLIQSTVTNSDLYIPTLKGIKIAEDELGTLVNNHARTYTKSDSYLVSTPFDLPTIKPAIKAKDIINEKANILKRIGRFITKNRDEIIVGVIIALLSAVIIGVFAYFIAFF